jgi:hypothetical protein
MTASTYAAAYSESRGPEYAHATFERLETVICSELGIAPRVSSAGPVSSLSAPEMEENLVASIMSLPAWAIPVAAVRDCPA